MYNSTLIKHLSIKELNLIKKIINQNDLEKQRNYLIKLSGLLYSRDEKLAMKIMEALAKVLIQYKKQKGG